MLATVMSGMGIRLQDHAPVTVLFGAGCGGRSKQRPYEPWRPEPRGPSPSLQQTEAIPRWVVQRFVVSMLLPSGSYKETFFPVKAARGP